jgi:hypothetical protein
MPLSVQEELEGLCESPHDDPPKWALMLTAYLDESFEGDKHGHAVIAGFLGNKESWEMLPHKWREALGDKESLHMKKLRWKEDRHKELLERLGSVPHACGLRPVYASIRVGEYINDLEDYSVREFTEGYFVALMGVASSILLALPKGERVEFIFESQIRYAAVREHALEIMSKNKAIRGRRGRSALAKWGSIPKSILLEPADYLAYAILQILIDKDSLKSRLCSPILNANPKPIGGRMSKEHVQHFLEFKRR